MSFASLDAGRNGTGMVLSRGELSLSLPAASLPSGVPAEVIVGVRPEHARLWSESDRLVGSIAGRVEYVEMLGRETLIGIVTAGDQRFAALAEADTAAKPGENVRFGVEPGRLHVFDVTTEQALGIV